MKFILEFRDRFLRALLFGRFEPIETTLSVSSAIHGATLLAVNLLGGNSILGVNSGLEIFAGSLLLVVGVSAVVSNHKDRTRTRRFCMFGQFLGWTMLASLVLVYSGLHIFVHLGYVTLSMVAAFLYLNMSLGGRSD